MYTSAPVCTVNNRRQGAVRRWYLDWSISHLSLRPVSLLFRTATQESIDSTAFKRHLGVTAVSLFIKSFDLDHAYNCHPVCPQHWSNWTAFPISKHRCCLSLSFANGFTVSLFSYYLQREWPPPVERAKDITEKKDDFVCFIDVKFVCIWNEKVIF